MCAEPMCSMSRDPRCCECTICTARAPDAVLTVRTYATTRQDRTARLVRASQHEPAGHRAAATRISETVAQVGSEALGRIRDAFHDYDGGVGGH